MINKCRWFGCDWGRWKLLPSPAFGGIPSSIRYQERICNRCGKVEVKYIRDDR